MYRAPEGGEPSRLQKMQSVFQGFIDRTKEAMEEAAKSITKAAKEYRDATSRPPLSSSPGFDSPDEKTLWDNRRKVVDAIAKLKLSRDTFGISDEMKHQREVSAMRLELAKLGASPAQRSYAQFIADQIFGKEKLKEAQDSLRALRDERINLLDGLRPAGGGVPQLAGGIEAGTAAAQRSTFQSGAAQTMQVDREQLEELRKLNDKIAELERTIADTQRDYVVTLGP